MAGTTTACPPSAVQNYYGVRGDAHLPYDPTFTPPAEPSKQQVVISRQNFSRLCDQLVLEGTRRPSSTL